ncbi:hypothetical protein DF185_02520 [Marinifilum breve]|uniref:O-antigen ligase-related domain-containing protein n=1 Tax=Marinifilum breve TaxID=2184082 RepID=A0A2V4A2P3_9BACT|nr:O-antigen ligase family protein [Marinifilum breve]PXY02986.1 hypothetical protein DF185_02520 [Marinifilum breve]
MKNIGSIRLLLTGKSQKDKIFLTILLLYFLVYMLPVPEVAGLFPCSLMVLYGFMTDSILKFRLRKYHWWGIQIFVFFAITSVWALRPILSYWSLMQMFKLFVLTFGIYKYATSFEKLYDILRVFVAANILLLLFVLYYFDLGSLGEDRMSDAENGLNGNGIAISFAFCLYGIFMIFNFIKLNYASKVYYYILAMVFLVFILLTGSRTGVVMLLLPIILNQFLKSKYKLTAIISISIFLIFAYFLVMKIPVFYNIVGVRIMDGLNIVSGNSTGAEDSSRFLLFVYGLDWFQDNPILGIGINNYRVLSNVTPPFVGKNFYAHSNIIELLVDVGIVGFIIYYRYVFILLRGAFKAAKDNVVSRIIIALTVTLFVHDIFSMSFYEWEMQFLICITFVLLSLNQKEVKPQMH